MENLPDRAITNIAVYLRPRELMACSAVSRKWREKFNIDKVWEPHLQFLGNHYKIQEKYKEMILCPPYFQTLVPLCVARENYIRDQCLRFNCRTGRFTVESFKPKSGIFVHRVVDHLDKDGNYWLFLITDVTIEVWNVTNKPYFHCSVSERLRNVDTLYIINTKIIAVYLDYVQVFLFEPPNFIPIFCCCFFFHDDVVTLDPGDPIGKKYHSNMKHFVTDNILLGHTASIRKSFLSNTELHIWNLDTLVKLEASTIVQERIVPYVIGDQDDLKGFIKFEYFRGDSSFALVALNEEENEKWKASALILRLDPPRVVRFLHSFERSKIIWCSKVKRVIAIIGFKHNTGYFLCLLSDSGTETALKILNKLDVIDLHQFSFTSAKIYVKTMKEVMIAEVMSDRLVVHSCLYDDQLSIESINVTNIFLFSSCYNGQVRLWDIDCCFFIKSLPSINGMIDISTITTLKDVRFPPKIICTNVAGRHVNVLSFW
uniref:F-box domain-containing protein n=1 Tax=Homalodisca liturata TaxID=320908 RepID=A0A1B6IRM6_9HEMI